MKRKHVDSKIYGGPTKRVKRVVRSRTKTRNFLKPKKERNFGTGFIKSNRNPQYDAINLKVKEERQNLPQTKTSMSQSKALKTISSRVRAILYTNAPLTEKDKLEIKSYPYCMCKEDQRKEFLNRIVVLLRRNQIRTRDLVGQDHKLRRDVLELILRDHKFPYTRAFIWYCFHKPRKEFNNVTDAIIRFTSRVSKKTVLITCGIAAFQHWVLNSSSKTRLTNPFDLGLVSTDAVIHSNERSLSLLRWVWWQTQSKTCQENIERCLDFGLQPLPNDFSHIPHRSDVSTPSGGTKEISLACMLQEGYLREKNRQKTIHDVFRVLKLPKAVPEIVISFIQLNSYFQNFARAANVQIF